MLKKGKIMKAEFDCYIQDYRKNLDKSLALSGESSTYFAQYKAAKLKEWLPNKRVKAEKILDFGCGDGMMTSFVADFFPKAVVYGVDPSPESIKVAQETYPKLMFSTNYDEKPDLGFADGTFDIIFAAGAFHHIPFDRHDGYAKEIYRILKPSGYFVMFELNPYNPLTVRTFKRNPIDQHATMLTPPYAKKFLKHSLGNDQTNIKFYCFYPHVFRCLRFTERFMTKIPFGALYAAIVKKPT
jgi:ubiquinone/menaquinone biosynthesis C-methylase UbiE